MLFLVDDLALLSTSETKEGLKISLISLLILSVLTNTNTIHIEKKFSKPPFIFILISNDYALINLSQEHIWKPGYKGKLH